MTSPEWLAADEDDADRARSTFDRADNTARLALELADAKRERAALVEQVREMGREAVAEAEAYRAVFAKLQAAEAEVERLREEVEHHLSETEVEAAQVIKWQQRYGHQMGVTDEWVSRALAAEAKVAKVEALHRPSGDIAGSTAAKLAERFGSACMHCAVPWPCPTIAVLADAPAEERAEGGE